MEIEFFIWHINIIYFPTSGTLAVAEGILYCSLFSEEDQQVETNIDEKQLWLPNMLKDGV